MLSFTRVIRSLVNAFGLAWWAKVETSQPNVIYWFGPFLSRKTLKIALMVFIKELSSENPFAIKHDLVRGRRKEPLTN